jgi:UDP-N-acetylglucosamine acyltransferase
MGNIHSTAIIDSRAELADNVTIGAYAIIKGHVRIGAGTVVQEHSHVHGDTVIGRNCRIGPAAYVGLDPQDLKYMGDKTRLVVGDNVVIRETATIHRSASTDPAHFTSIGDGCFIMAAAHVAHDCYLAKNVIIANAVLLGGHIHIGERAFLGGGFTLHQFCRVGRLAVVAGNEALSQDVPPFAAVRDRSLKGYNAVGCRRAGLTPEAVVAIRAAYRCLRVNRQMSAVVQAIRDSAPVTTEVQEILDFIASSERGIVPSIVALRHRITVSADPDQD